MIHGLAGRVRSGGAGVPPAFFADDRRDAGPTNPRRRRRAGFALVEMVVVMVLLGVTMAVSVQLFNGAFALGRSAAAGDRRANWRRDAVDAFRRDVAAAESATAEGESLALQLPGGRRVTYRLADGVLTRTLARPGSADVVTPLGSGVKLASATFAVSAGPRPLASAEVREMTPRGPGRLTRFHAAVGGDLR